MLFRFIPRDIISEVIEQWHINALLRDNNYEVLKDIEPEIVTEPVVAVPKRKYNKKVKKQ